MQNETARKVVMQDDFSQINRICGVDVAYIGDVAFCSAVVMDKNSQLVESVDSETEAKHSYVAGLLMLREAGPIFDTLEMLKSSYDLLLANGHGVLHPRKCGLACHIGVNLDKPTIGVAKSLLCGNVKPGGFVEMGGEILGYKLSSKMYISVGHKISLKTAIAILKEHGTEPLKKADINSKAQKMRKGLRT